MNIITILIDSLNRDSLSIYNPETRVRTPNIDRLAARGTVFDNHFVGSLPCMPARRAPSTWRLWSSTNTHSLADSPRRSAIAA